MESNSTNGLSFGGLGFGSKPAENKENRPNVFGGTAFGGQQEAPKPTFGSTTPGGGFIKTPTFTFQNSNAAPATSQPAPVFGGQGAFGANTSQSGNLFNSFTSPQKPVFGQSAFGAQPTFGGGTTFGGGPTSPAPLFGVSSGATGAGAFGAAAANKPLFGASADGGGGGNLFSMLAQQSSQPQQPQQSLFGSFCKLFFGV